jgi:hypothetical protein
MRARRPDLPPLRQLSVEDVKNCLSEGKFYQKVFKFSPKWVNLKVPKCEIFHLFDFNDFYGIKPL